jgi:hypothetical protein
LYDDDAGGLGDCACYTPYQIYPGYEETWGNSFLIRLLSRRDKIKNTNNWVDTRIRTEGNNVYGYKGPHPDLNSFQTYIEGDYNCNSGYALGGINMPCMLKNQLVKHDYIYNLENEYKDFLDCVTIRIKSLSGADVRNPLYIVSFELFDNAGVIIEYTMTNNLPGSIKTYNNANQLIPQSLFTQSPTLRDKMVSLGVSPTNFFHYKYFGRIPRPGWTYNESHYKINNKFLLKPIDSTKIIKKVKIRYFMPIYSTNMDITVSGVTKSVLAPKTWAGAFQTYNYGEPFHEAIF